LNPIKALLSRLFSWRKSDSSGSAITLGEAELKMMIEGIFSTREDEITCGECYNELDRFAEMVLAGKDTASAVPLVEDHLKRCRCCREEFEALLGALKAQA
jgi:hypothetical protein